MAGRDQIEGNDELAHLLAILNGLQDLMDAEPDKFGEGLAPEIVRDAIAAWEATNTLAELYLSRVRAARGIDPH